MRTAKSFLLLLMFFCRLTFADIWFPGGGSEGISTPAPAETGFLRTDGTNSPEADIFWNGFKLLNASDLSLGTFPFGSDPANVYLMGIANGAQQYFTLASDPGKETIFALGSSGTPATRILSVFGPLYIQGADDDVADANPAGTTYIRGGNKSDGTGPGGDLDLSGGASSGGPLGLVKLGDTLFKPGFLLLDDSLIFSLDPNLRVFYDSAGNPALDYSFPGLLNFPSLTPSQPVVTDGMSNLLSQSYSDFTANLDEFVGDSGSGGIKGLVPAPASGDAASGKFLHSNGGYETAVTEVALTAPSIFTVSGSPISTTGTLDFELNDQDANKVFAGPVSGGAAPPTFRLLDSDDIPILDEVSTPGNVSITTAGNGLQIKTGANQRAGTTALVAGTSTVANTGVTANTICLATVKVLSGIAAPVGVLCSISAGASLTITSASVLDTSTVSYMLVEANP